MKSNISGCLVANNCITTCGLFSMCMVKATKIMNNEVFNIYL